jgi:3-dehydroquinate synthetase
LAVAQEVEEVWTRAQLPGRKALAKGLAGAEESAMQRLLLADKKNQTAQSLRMVLLKGLGEVVLREVAFEEWRPLAKYWHKGDKP